ncbi:MAG: hypothetical protein WC750_02840 [Patescibacteria group bacterium]|jgi:hypothetical protein
MKIIERKGVKSAFFLEFYVVEHPNLWMLEWKRHCWGQESPVHGAVEYVIESMLDYLLRDVEPGSDDKYSISVFEWELCDLVLHGSMSVKLAIWGESPKQAEIRFQCKDGKITYREIYTENGKEVHIRDCHNKAGKMVRHKLDDGTWDDDGALIETVECIIK